MDRALSEPAAPEVEPVTTPRLVRGQRIALVDLLDRLLAGGVVITGDVTISIANVDLVRISLRALIASIRPEMSRAYPFPIRAEAEDITREVTVRADVLEEDPAGVLAEEDLAEEDPAGEDPAGEDPAP